MKIDPTKKYRTRDGQEVTGLASCFGPTTYPIQGYVGRTSYIWTADGAWCIRVTSPLDLVEVVPEPLAFDPTKPVQTRDGRKAGIYSTGNPGPYPIHGWVEHVDGSRVIACWTNAGQLLAANRAQAISDLVNIPPPAPRRGTRTGYVNVYMDGNVRPRDTRANAADKNASPDRIACIKWTEGQFDE